MSKNEKLTKRIRELELAGHNAPSATSANFLVTELVLLAMDANDMAVEQHALQAAASISMKWWEV